MVIFLPGNWFHYVLLHLVLLSSVTIDFSLDVTDRIGITATVRSSGGQTGVSMEAMTAVSVAACSRFMIWRRVATVG